MFTQNILFLILIHTKFVHSIFDENKIIISISNASSEIKLIEENFFEREEAIHEILTETQLDLKNLTKSLNNSSLYPKLLKVIGEISEIVNGIPKYDDAAPLTVNGSVCESIQQNIKHLQFFIKKFACCQSKAISITARLTIKKITLKIQKALNYQYLKVNQDKMLSEFVSCLDSLTSEYKKFVWFLLTSMARETFLLGKMLSYQIALCSKATPKTTSTKFTTEISEVDALATILSTKTSSRDVEEIDENYAQFDLKYKMSKPIKLQSVAQTVKSVNSKVTTLSGTKKISSTKSKKNSSTTKNVKN
jgi:hypothetical protein